MTVVNMTQLYHPPNRSASPEPSPPASAPIIGPKVKAVVMTIASPRLKYPLVAGIGNANIIVAMVASAPMTPIAAIWRVFSDAMGYYSYNYNIKYPSLNYNKTGKSIQMSMIYIMENSG